MSKETSDNSLRKNRLGVLGIVFFVVAASAPLVGMTGGFIRELGSLETSNTIIVVRTVSIVATAKAIP